MAIDPKLFQINVNVLEANGLLGSDHVMFSRTFGRLIGTAMTDEWSNPGLILGDYDRGVTPIMAVLRTFGATSEMRQSRCGLTIDRAGEWLEASLEDTGEKIFVANVTRVVDCLVVEKTEFREGVDVVYETGVDYGYGFTSPAVIVSAIDSTGLFRIPQQRGTLFMATLDGENEFLDGLKECGLEKYFQIQEVPAKFYE